LTRQPNLLWIFGMCVLLGAAATPAGAQRPRGLCWRGPTADCAIILLSEAGYHHALSSTGRNQGRKG
jgi:hypothetical protein